MTGQRRTPAVGSQIFCFREQSWGPVVLGHRSLTSRSGGQRFENPRVSGFREGVHRAVSQQTLCATGVPGRHQAIRLTDLVTLGR